MVRIVAKLALRFLVAAAIYAGIVYYWVDNANGWDSIGLFAAGLAFGAIAALAWFVSIVAGQLLITNEMAQLAAHPVVTTALFVALAASILSGFLDDPPEMMWRDVKQFIPLIAISALLDAIVGFLLGRRTAAAPGGAT